MEKHLPQNIEAECGVLGSIIIDPEAIVQVADFLHPEDFYRDAHRTIYEVILQLYEQHEPADFITICDELERRNKLEAVGGASYITSLVNIVPTSGNVEYYGRIVERMAILRRLIQAAGTIAAIAYEESDAEVALDKAEQLIFNISQNHARNDFSSLGDIISSYMEKLEQLHERRGTIIGVPTGFTDLDRLTGGLQRSDLIILAARPAVGKCLTARTLIDDPATGERLIIEECVRRRLPTVYGISEDGKIRPAVVSDWIDSGVQPCFRVQTHSGRMVEVTGHHPFLTVHGWVPLHDLQVGQHIAVPTAVPCFGADESWPLEKVRLLAYFIAEGGLTGISPMFTNTDPVIVEDFKQIIANHYPECALRQERITYAVAQKKSPYTQRGVAILPTNPVTAWLRELGIMGKSAQEKFFPACVWQWSRRYLAEFLRALMSCDGSIYLHSHGTPVIEFTVASQQLASDLYHAFVRFGIISKYYQKTQNSWRVTITNPRSVKRYQDEIGWIGEKAIRCYRLAGYAEVLDDDLLRRDASPDIYWDEIIAIEPIGEQQVYDLTVPDGANFVAQDVFVHNTSFALSLAHNSAIKHQRSVAIFSLEMSKEQLIQRFIAMNAGIDQQRLRTGWIEDNEWDNIIEAMEKLSGANIWIDDTAGISTMEMRSKARRLLAEHGVDLIVVDYLQLMQSDIGGKRNENRVQEVSEISRNLKGLARELNVPVLALAQLSRTVESRQSKVPQLSDLRESGCLAGDTPIYLPDEGIYRPIEQLVGKSGFRVLALNTETWQLEPRVVTNAFATGHKPVYKMTTRLGRTIRATANHKFLTINGWKRLDELAKNERIALVREEKLRINAGAVRHNPHKRQVRTGQMRGRNELSEGTVRGRGAVHQPALTCHDPSSLAGMLPNVGALFHKPALTCHDLSSLAERTPGESVSQEHGNRQVNTGLWNSAPTLGFIPTLGITLTSSPYGERIGQSSKVIESDVHWDEITAIEPDGEADVYDLTVEGLHNFIANNIIAHNSIEQDADIVMFIYRDEVYNPDTERKNIADIIVAKHRNGPTGEISLYFQASQTRFADLEVSPPAEE